MILIDALYINNGGGKVLLDYLIQELNKLDIEIFYLFDKRIENTYYLVNPKSQKCFLESSFTKRKQFYLKNDFKETDVFYTWQGEDYVILSRNGIVQKKEFWNFWDSLKKEKK